MDTATANLDLYTNVTFGQTIASAEESIKSAQLGVQSAQAGVGSAQANVQNANAAVNSAKAAENMGETQLSILMSQKNDYTVVSPINGVVINKLVVAGGISGQSPVYTIADVDKVIIETAVPKEEISKLSLGSNVQVFYGDGTSVIAAITALSNVANAANLYMVQTTVDNKNDLLKPGMNANIIFVENQSQNLVVPYNAVVNNGKENYIFVDDNNKAKQVDVHIIGKNAYQIAIEAMDTTLDANVPVVTKNATILKDGNPISVAN